ncbi:cupin [Parasphingopyxis algicola]|uniref:cupin domain-containing protein n=1 Tax=Parasphingopyxis algicola TaxID=2026624 RepID=UPI0015A1C366|nr:cupin domain-containing protein [Parasphingopyxis algicola]QLC26062.1 cupin [Parasphingopyxis algicola]
MRINADFSQRAVVRPGDVDWVASPMAGVERQMLDRVGEEVARATSIVRYAAGSRFSEHVHGGGEEFFVLDGVFSDERGDYPAGTYVRNPIGTRHAPHSEDGCTIFVKLHQFDDKDTAHFSIDTRAAEFRPGWAEGLSVLPLHAFGAESVALVRWEPGTTCTGRRHPGGAEILVLDGVFQDEQGDYPAGSWIRHPHLAEHRPFSEQGCQIYMKTGHLPDIA